MDEIRRGSDHSEIYSKPPLWKVFVSSVMRNGSLNEERIVAAEAIEKTGLAKAWYWERDAVAGPYSSEKVCLGQAGTSDILILLLADKITPIVRKEYDAARDSGAACFIFVKGDFELEPEAKQFLDQERAIDQVTRKFHNLEQLGDHIDKAIKTHAIRSGRSKSLGLRFRRSGLPSFDGADLSIGHSADPTTTDKQLSGLGGLPENAPSPLDEVIQRVNTLVAAGHFRGAIDLISSMAQFVEGVGFAQDALKLISLARNRIPEEAIERADWAWLLNTEGLALIEAGYRSEALSRFDMMRDIGEEIGDRELVSVAMQNTAIVALMNGEHDQSAELTALSLREKMAIDDLRGCVQLINNLATLAQEQGNLEEAAKLLAINEPIVRDLKEPGLLATYHGNLGNLAAKSRGFAEAERLYRISLGHSRRSGDLAGQVVCLQNLGAVHSDQGQYSVAIRWYRKALQLAERLEVSSRRQVLHASLGLVFNLSGRNSEALEQFDAGRNIAAELGDRNAWAALTADFGAVLISLGRANEAIPPIRQAIEIFRELRDDVWLARGFLNLVEAHAALGAADSAATAAESALRFLPIDAHAERANALLRVAQTGLENYRNHQRSADFFQRALIEQRTMSTEREFAWQTTQAARTLHDHGAYALAVPFYSQAVETLERINDSELLYKARNDRANALTALDRFVEARHDYETCLAIAKSREDRLSEFQSRMNLGEMERRAGNFDFADSSLRHALELARKLEDGRAEAEALGNLGICLSNEGNHKEARKTFVAARKLARRHRHKSAEAVAVSGLAREAFIHENYHESAKLYKRAIEIDEEINDDFHLIEDIAGLTESLAALGDVEGVSDAGQRLIDVAQKMKRERIAVKSLSAAGRKFLIINLADASIDIFGAAIIGALFANPEDLETIAWPFLTVVLTAREVLSVDEQESLYKQILSSVEKNYDLPEETMDFLRQLLHEAKKTWSSRNIG